MSRRLSAVLLANIATHPAVWLVFPRLGFAWIPTTIVAELWAFGLEAWLYALVFLPGKARTAVLLSFVANVASFAAGVLLWRLGIL